MDAGLAAALAQALESPVTAARSLSGGDINEAYQVDLADGRRLFVKTNARAPREMFAAEARGLGWLAEAGALRTPAVVAWSPRPGAGGAAAPAPSFLALELIAEGSRSRDFDERLGRGLAALHRFGAPCFGLDHDNFIGRLPQANAPLPRDDWAEFYRARRLEPQLQRAAAAGLAPASLRRRFERLFVALADLVGPPEPPSRLHGDLWGGNLLGDESGAPCVIDPAVYGGHREVDLAMMRLFGGFGPRVFDAYLEAWPLAPGHERRVALYQLYPLLVHVNLFGGGYIASVEAALDRLL